MSTTIRASLIHVDVKKLGNVPDGGGPYVLSDWDVRQSHTTNTEEHL